jgi:RNA polymerase primary sigma factor
VSAAIGPTAAEIAVASEGRLLTAAEEQALGWLIKAGDQEARDLLALKNDALVWSLSFKYTCAGMTDDDLHGYGFLGLLKAIERWDPGRKLKFSTYATWWIRQALTRAVMDYGRQIRLPVHLNDRVGRISRATAKLAAELNRMPTDLEICAEARVSQQHLDAAKRAQLVSNTTSLEASTAGPADDDRALIDVVPDLTALEAESEPSLLAEQVERYLGRLPKRLAYILRLRFGFDGFGRNRTLTEVGDILGLTRERVRQLEAQAFEQIRAFALPRPAVAAD